MNYLLATACLCLSLFASCATSPLENVEGFAFVATATGEPLFAASVRGDVQKGCIVYGAEGDVGLRDTNTKFRFTAPLEGLEIGQIRYWDKDNDVRETVPIGSLLPDWVATLFTPQEIELLGLTFQGAPLPAP